MKNKLLIACAFLCSTFAFAQQKSSSLAFSGGITEKSGLGLMANYTYSSLNSNYEFSVLHSMFKEENITPINYSTTTLNLGYLHSVIRNSNNSISVNIGAGVSGGYESVPANDDFILESKSGFIVGGFAVVQTDFYISDTFSIVFRAQQNYLAIATTGNMNPYLAAGIKFNL